MDHFHDLDFSLPLPPPRPPFYSNYPRLIESRFTAFNGRMDGWMEPDLFFFWKCSRPRHARMTLRERTPAAALGPSSPAREATFACLPCMLSRCSIFRSTGSPGHYDSEDKNVLKPQSTISNDILQLQCLFIVSFSPSAVVLKPKDDREGEKDEGQMHAHPRPRRPSVGVRPDLDLSVFPPLFLLLRDFSRVFRRSDRPYVINEFLLR